MSLNLSNTVLEFLSNNSETKFTAREIAEWIFREYPEECEKKKARSKFITNDSDLTQQIVREISAQSAMLQKRSVNLKTTQERPRKFYWTARLGRTDAEFTDATGDVKTPAVEYSEFEVYPLLSAYLWSEFHLYSKRIDEKRSANRYGKNGNKWLYPDIVGMEDLTVSWHEEVKGGVEVYPDKKTKLWSFEVKVELNRSNLREAFFQTVSNSSWANVGYLVACRVEGLETMTELRMLSALHGIGLVELNSEAPAESKILIPAREKQVVDWAICSRLTHENKDFLQYVKLVRQFHLTGDPRQNDWDIPVD